MQSTVTLRVNTNHCHLRYSLRGEDSAPPPPKYFRGGQYARGGFDSRGRVSCHDDTAECFSAEMTTNWDKIKRRYLVSVRNEVFL